jgi:predicted nucleic-acid-binding protein
MLLSHQQLVVDRSEIVEAALGQFRAKPRVGFSDCLMLEIARAAGHLPLGTFDKALSRREGAKLLT